MTPTCAQGMTPTGEMDRNNPDGDRPSFARYELAGCRLRSVHAICGLVAGMLPVWGANQRVLIESIASDAQISKVELARANREYLASLGF